MKSFIIALVLIAPTSAIADKCKGGFKWKIDIVEVNGNNYQISPHRKLNCLLVNESRAAQVIRGNPLAKKTPLPFDEMKAAANKYLGKACAIADPVAGISGIPINWHVRYSC